MSLRPPLAALALSLGIGAPAAARVPPRHHPPSTRPPAHPASPARSKSHAAHPPSSASPRVVDLPSEIPPTAAPETPAPVEEARPSRRWPYALPLPIAGVAALAVWLRRRRREEKVVAVAHAAARARGVAELQGHDPDFDPPAFLARAHRTIEAVRAAWAAGSMAPARRLVSDGVFVRFQSRIELLRGEGLRHVVLADSVDELELLAAESDRSWDSVHVKVVGERRAADVPLSLEPRAARRAARTAEPVEVQEVWSFVRRRGLRSRGGAPALDGQCPSCGGAIPDGAPPGTADVRCRYCKAVWNSGEHDWVLLDVTPPEEW